MIGQWLHTAADKPRRRCPEAGIDISLEVDLPPSAAKFTMKENVAHAHEHCDDMARTTEA